MKFFFFFFNNNKTCTTFASVTPTAHRKKKMAHILHIVALKFKPEFTEERIQQHFEEEVALLKRMPELVKEYSWKKNISLEDRKDVNGGCQYVVLCKLHSNDPAKLTEYLAHPQHKEVGVIQNPMLDGRFVVDVLVD